MSTLLGSTSHPSGGLSYWEGASADNQIALRLTLPAGGPWLVSKVGVWAAGKDSGVSAKLVLWANGSSVLGQSAAFTLAGHAFGVGNSDKYEKDLADPVEVAGGTTVMVGLARNPSGAHQWDTNAAGTTYKRERSTWPGSMASYATVSDGMGAWLYYDPASPEVYVRRSGAWVKADDLLVRRSGAWASLGPELYVQRSGVWVKVS